MFSVLNSNLTSFDCVQAKVRLLQQYVSDLTEQNEVLVQTMEDVDKQHTDKVAQLEQKLITANNDVKVCLAYHLDHQFLNLGVNKNNSIIF